MFKKLVFQRSFAKKVVLMHLKDLFFYLNNFKEKCLLASRTVLLLFLMCFFMYYNSMFSFDFERQHFTNWRNPRK